MPARDQSRPLRNPDLVQANRMPREEPSGPIDVRVDLIVQFQCRAELPLAPQKMMKVQAHDVAVDVGVEIKDVTLDGQRVIFIQRRANADVGHAFKRMREALEPRSGHVDAGAGVELVRWFDVDGWEADLAAQAASGNDTAVDEVCAAESQRHRTHRSFGDGIAYDRAGDANAANAHLVNTLDGESQPRTGCLELRQIAFASRAETEIASDVHVVDLQGGDQKFLNESVRGPAREFVRERNHQQRVDVHRPKDFLLLSERQDLLRYTVGSDDRKRMRVECDHRRRALRFARTPHDATNNLLMPGMHAVEVADGGDAAARQIGLPEDRKSVVQ